MNTDMNVTAIQQQHAIHAPLGKRYSERNLLGYAAILGIALFGVRAQAVTIEFNDHFPAPYSFVPHPGAGSDVFYSEDGMTFVAVNHSHYHFFPEDPSLFDQPGEQIPADAPKFLIPHTSGAVVRMIYDPDRDGVPNRFNLVGLEVKSGAAFKVHAEVDYSGVNGGVWGPLGEGNWSTPDAGLLFVDFNPCLEECSNGGIDNIVFEPAAGTGPTATCNGIRATVVGTPGDDTVVGTSLPDMIHGLGGNDTIVSYSGNDVICGGDGNETIISGIAPDRKITKAGIDDDVVYGGNGNDKLVGGDGDDKLNGGKGTDTCDGGRHISGDAATACEKVTNVP